MNAFMPWSHFDAPIFDPFRGIPLIGRSSENRNLLSYEENSALRNHVNSSFFGSFLEVSSRYPLPLSDHGNWWNVNEFRWTICSNGRRLGRSEVEMKQLRIESECQNEDGQIQCSRAGLAVRWDSIMSCLSSNGMGMFLVSQQLTYLLVLHFACLNRVWISRTEKVDNTVKFEDWENG